MKKLLVLALVLGLASVASAALTWEVSSVSIVAGSTATVKIHSSTATYAGGPAFIGVYDDVADFASFTPIGTTTENPGAGDNAAAVKDAGGWTGYWTINANAGDPATLAAGWHWTAVINGLKVGTNTLQLDTDGSAGAADDLVVTVTPEPMTVALLGLGGLFLRRRK